MCGRFYVPDDEANELLAAMIREASRRLKAQAGMASVAVGEVLPSSYAAVLARGRSGVPGVFPMRWGFRRPDGKGLLINTRSETALQRPMFRASMRERRCLIPMAWYFEWQDLGGRNGKIKYAIWPQKEEISYLAGIYRYEEESSLPVFSVLTREAAPGIAFIHPRMPVIFDETLRDAWLEPTSDPEELMRSCRREMICRTA